VAGAEAQAQSSLSHAASRGAAKPRSLDAFDSKQRQRRLKEKSVWGGKGWLAPRPFAGVDK